MARYKYVIHVPPRGVKIRRLFSIVKYYTHAGFSRFREPCFEQWAEWVIIVAIVTRDKYFSMGKPCSRS